MPLLRLRQQNSSPESVCAVMRRRIPLLREEEASEDEDIDLIEDL